MGCKQIVSLALGTTLIASATDSTASAQCIPGGCRYPGNVRYAATAWDPMHVAMLACIARQQQLLWQTQITLQNAIQQARIAQEQTRIVRATGTTARCGSCLPVAGNVRTAQARLQLQRLARLAREEKEKARLKTHRDVAALNEHYRSILEIRRTRTKFRRDMAKAVAEEAAEKRSNAWVLDQRRGFVFDPSSGEIRWPSLFGDSRFAADRARIDTLFAGRDRDDSGLGSRNHGEVLKAVNGMLKTVETMTRNRELNPGSHGALKKFLNSLAYETQFVAEAGQRIAAK